MNTELPDLSRTEAAIAAYDEHDATFGRCVVRTRGRDQVFWEKWFAKSDELGRAVGHAYGLDTADRNSMDTCEGLIRPGQKDPGPGYELSFVRRMVKQWRQQQAKK